MKLVHEKHVNKGLLIRTVCAGDRNAPLLPGDMIRHFQDHRSSGIIVAVSGDGREDTDLEALVLWSKLPFNGNYPPTSTLTPEQELDELVRLANMGIISKKTLMESYGLDHDELLEDVRKVVER